MREKGTLISEINREFRNLEKEYIKKIKENKKKCPEKEIENFFEGKENSNEDNLFEGEQELEKDYDVNEKENMKIVEKTLKNVQTLNDMLNDMKAVVLESGSTIDRIDHSLSEAVEYADSGYKEMVEVNRKVYNERSK